MSYPTRLFISTAVLGGLLIFFANSVPAQSQTAPAVLAEKSVPTVLSEVKPALLINGYRMSKIIGSKIVNDQNETIGVVDDVIMSASPEAPFFVVSVGGLLGMGTRHVLVASHSIDLQGGRILLPGGTVAELKNLPIFAYTN
jgi:PRC-barrel domain